MNLQLMGQSVQKCSLFRFCSPPELNREIRKNTWSATLASPAKAEVTHFKYNS